MKRSIRIKKQEKLNNPHSFSSGLGTGIGGLLLWGFFVLFFFSIFFLSPILINILLHAILFQISSFLDLINSSSIRILLFSNYLSLIIFCLIDISLPLNCELFLIKITDRFTYFLQV